MGFQGSLASVNLADIMQTLAVNRQTGTLVVKHRGDNRNIWFDQGEVALADGADADGGPLLLAVLRRRSMLTPKQAEDLHRRLYDTGQPLRDIILASGLLPDQDLDEVAIACLEDKVCEIFEWEDGDFSFVDGPPVPQLGAAEVIEAGAVRLQTQSVVMEAMRRRDEWTRINEIIPDQNEIYVVDNEGRNNLRNIDTAQDPDMVKVLRYLDGRHSTDRIADLVGIPRFDAYAIVAQLVMAGAARASSPQEILADALALRDAGEAAQAAVLLENAAVRMDLPEVIRPLAELKRELGETPRAVELYLELIQRAQDDGDFAQALADLDTVIEINPDDPDIQVDRAEVLLDLDRIEEASRAFVTAASNHLATRDIKLAVDACHRARDLDPASPDPHRLLAKAHLLDNQSENAVAEYRSLWHSLLSHHRPRRALDQLAAILAEDCKFQRVTDTVLEHARGSDAVKTGSAVRMLVYLLILVVLGGAGYAGWRVWETKVALDNRRQAVDVLETRLLSADVETDFADISDALRGLQSANADPDLATRINTLIALHESKFEDAAAELRADLDRALADHRLDDAQRLAGVIATRYRKSEAGTDIDEIVASIADRRARGAIADRLADLERQWADHAWEAAIEGLRALRRTDDLTEAVRAELDARLQRWERDLASSEFLFRKAEELECTDHAQQARSVYLRAMQAEGDFYRDEARKKLVALEDSIAADKRDSIATAVEQEDADQIFTLLDDLRHLVDVAHGTRPGKELAAVQLPLALTLDHPAVTVTVDDGDRRRTITAPEAATDRWRIDLTYPATGGLEVRAARVGFDPVDLRVTAADRRTAISVELERGPLWQADLRSTPVTTPQIGGGFVLVATTDSKVHFVSRDTGSSSMLPYDPIHNFRHPPRVHVGTAFLTLGGQIHAADIATRSRLWSWPDQSAIDAPAIGRYGLWVQEHELIPGQQQLFAGAQPPGGLDTGSVVTLAIDQRTLELERYPDTPVQRAISGPPVVAHSVLYLPAGRHILAFDSTSASRRQGLDLLYEFPMRAEIALRPVATEVDGAPAVLVTDDTGTVFALDADPRVGNESRIRMQWTLKSAAAASPVIGPEGDTAYVSTGEIGGVTALNLDRPKGGPRRWRFPRDGQIGSVPGAPAVGRNGIYVADATGIIYCLDRDTGRELWRTDLQSGIVTGVAAADGRIYVGTRSGMLLCFEEGEL